jgi:hypothetical protein
MGVSERVPAVPLDAVLAELTTASAQLVFTEAGERRAPIAIGGSAADVSVGARARFGNGHPNTPSTCLPNDAPFVCNF